MRRLTICIALVLSLAFAGDALAKEVTSAKVCGPSECRETRDRADLTLFQNGGGPTDPPAAKSPWYSVRLTMKIEGASDEHFTQVFVPRGGLLRGGDATEGYVWMALAPTDARRYRELTRGLASYPAARLSGTGPPKVRVDEVVLGPQQPAESGGASPLPWIGGGVALLAAGLFLLLRRRGRGLRWPRPSEG